jgi:hypothetical protein
MKQISYTARIKEVGGTTTWTEDYADLVVDEMTPLQHCKFLMSRFNNTLRPGEKAREVLRVRCTPIPNVLKGHNWKKKSLVTEKGGYDNYQCQDCGVTGKRWGLVAFVTPDRKNTIYCKAKRRRTT